MAPVRMPGAASGSTWWKIACIFDAPTPSAASRIDGGTALSAAARGDDDGGQRHQREHQGANNRGRLRKANKIDEQRQAENTEHNRGNSGQIGNVDLDQIGPAVLGANSSR
jgi:hypothetical protein